MARVRARSLVEWDGSTAMNCTDFNVDCAAGDLIRVSANFVMLISGDDGADVISEALRRVSLYLASGKIELVKAGDGPRCFYCGVSGRLGQIMCEQCGGSY